MKLVYIHGNKITSEMANLLQVVSMCDAFASKGVNVELVTPYTKEKIDNPHEYLSSRFEMENGLDLSFYSKMKLFNRLDILGSYFGIKKYLNKNKNKANLYFTRSPLIFFLLANKKLPVIYEAHNSKIHNNIKLFDRYWSQKVIEASQISSCLAFIPISEKLGDYWREKGVPPQKILPLHDGFNNQMFKENIPKNQARLELKLPVENKIVTYTGSLYPNREIENIIELAKHFSKELFIVVGGPQKNADHYQSVAKKQGITNINFTGPVEHSRIPLYLYASDVLLALWSKKVPTINYCSPLKIFEYMAAGRIIVAHGFPTIKEIIRHEENGLLVLPGNFEDLIEKTSIAINNTNHKNIEKQARADAFEKYTWNKRVTKILEAINN